MSDVPLKEFIEAQVAKERELRELQLAETHKALALARDQINDRLEGMNELRTQINAERNLYISRELFDRMHSMLDERMRVMENFKSNVEGRMWVAAAVLLLIQLSISVAVFLIKRGGT